MKITSETFTYAFQEEGWQEKALIGSALAFFSFLFVPILPLMGYSLRVMRHNINEETLRLPAWDNWGELFADGIKMIVVNFVYLIPMWVVMCCGMFSQFAVLPFFPFMEDTPELVIGMVVVQMVGVAILMIGSLIALPLGYLSYVGQARMAAKDLSAAFDFRSVWKIATKGLKHFLVAFAIYYGISYAIGMLMTFLWLTIILICVFPFVMALFMYYSMVLNGTLFGVAYRETQAELAATEGV